MALTIERRRLRAVAPDAAALRDAHLAGGRAVFIGQEGRIDVVDVERGDRVRSLDYPGATSGRLSPGGHRLLVYGLGALWCELISLDDGAVLARLERDPHDRHTVNTSFLVDRSGDDVVLVTRQNTVLEGLRADDAAPVFRIECRRPIVYYFADPVAMLDGDTIMALGRQPSEGKDSFYRFSLALCRDDPDAAGRIDPTHSEPSEYAYRVAVGPCGPDALVAFRDARDREVLEEGEVHDNPLYGFNGIYVRRLADCAVLERLAYDGAIETGARVMGTRDAIVVARGDELDVIERGMLAPAIQSLTTGKYLLDPATGSIYELAADGAIDALTFHRST